MAWPLSPLETAWCALALLLGYGVRSVAGFGSGVIAAPLLTFAMPLSTVAPVITLLGLLVSFQQAVRDWMLIDWRRLRVLVPGSIAGVVLGVFAFKSVDAGALARWLGVYVLLYAVYSLAGPRLVPKGIAMPRWIVHPVAIVGALVATLFGGLAGPIYVTYYDAQRLPKQVFRVTVSTTLLVLGVLRSIAYLASGVFRAQDFVLIAGALVPVAIGTYVGDRLHHRLDPVAFRRGVAVLLVVSGLALMVAH